MRHKHTDLIIVWSIGAKIEVKCSNGEWKDVIYPCWSEDLEYRIKSGCDITLFENILQLYVGSDKDGSISYESVAEPQAGVCSNM